MGVDGKHRPLVAVVPHARHVLGTVAGILFAWDAAAEGACRHALALGLDVSGSVDAIEYNLQRRGLAQALMAPDVQDILLRSPKAPVWLTVFEWSGPNHQTVLQPWTAVTGDNIEVIARHIASQPRIPAPPTTAIGPAMQIGAQLLNQQQGCWRHTLDISGDGIANTGVRPQDVALTSLGITVNALVIIADGQPVAATDLIAYFEAYVIRGSDAFVEIATGFDDYANAMERKLLRELGVVAVSSRD